MPASPPHEPAEPSAAAPGALIDARLPGMAGKIRPGLVIHSVDASIGRLHVAVPLTTLRTSQPGALPIVHPTLRPSFLLIPVASIVPERLVLSIRGAVPAETLSAAAAEMDRWFGADWRAAHPQLIDPRDQAKRLNGATLKPRP